MRVLILNSARKFIGEAAHCLDLTRELNKRGHDALLVVRKGYELEERAQQADVPTVALNFPSQFAPRLDLADIAALRKLVHQWKPDIVHCHRGKDHWIAALAKLCTPWSFPPLVRTRHVVVPMAQHFLNAFLLTRLTAQTIAVSQAAARSLGQIGNRLGPRLHVIYSAVDTEKFRPDHRSQSIRDEFGADENSVLIGLIARLQNIKGQKVFVRAARLVNKVFPNTRFLIAGRGSQVKFQALTKHIKDMGLEHCMVLREWLPNLPAVLASLDVSVIASLGSEGSSRIAYESMASGVPLVATRVGCLEEIIADHQTGLLVPPGDAEALAAALCELVRNAEFARRLATAALQRVRSFHTYDRWVHDMLRIYQLALEGHRP
jgi:glycosyltransferase involved in cell wall biosynthesis